MKVRMYTMEREPGTHFSARSGFYLLSYADDVREFPGETDPEMVAPRLSRELRRNRLFTIYTTDVYPEWAYTIPSGYTLESRRKHSLRLWAEGDVKEILDVLRPDHVD